MLGHACGGMSEHDGYILQGNVVGERDGGSESMAGHMRGQIFLYADRVFPVFLQYGQGNGQQRDVADGRRFSAALQLDPSFPYPPVPEIVLHQILIVQAGYIGERQAGEATKWQVITFRKNTEMKT